MQERSAFIFKLCVRCHRDHVEIRIQVPQLIWSNGLHMGISAGGNQLRMGGRVYKEVWFPCSVACLLSEGRHLQLILWVCVVGFGTRVVPICIYFPVWHLLSFGLAQFFCYSVFLIDLDLLCLFPQQGPLCIRFSFSWGGHRNCHYSMYIFLVSFYEKIYIIKFMVKL